MRHMFRAGLASLGLLAFAAVADAQVYVRAPFVRVGVGPGVYVRAPFVNLYVPSGPRYYDPYPSGHYAPGYYAPGYYSGPAPLPRYYGSDYSVLPGAPRYMPPADSGFVAP